jgi:hypothetical protein
MILTRFFVFLHVPKTGGNFVRRVLVDHAPPDWDVVEAPDHATWQQVPDSHARLPRIAFVRNPYAWYVSWLHFQQRVRAPFFLQISDGGRLGFADTLWRALGPGGPFATTSGPFLQTLLELCGPGLENVGFGRLEAMRDDLLALLSLCAPPAQSVTDAILAMPAQNTSEHLPWQAYYDPPLRELVRRKEAPVFAHFGYEWEEPST